MTLAARANPKRPGWRGTLLRAVVAEQSPAISASRMCSSTAGSAWWTVSLRVWMSSLRSAMVRWFSTVVTVRNSVWAISRLL
jgi:hypothetical protein